MSFFTGFWPSTSPSATATRAWPRGSAGWIRSHARSLPLMALNTRRRIALALALACGAADLAVKAAVGGGLRHERGPLVALISLAVAVALPAVVPRLPSTAAAVAAGIGSGGAVGNGLSALAWPGGVPDPLVLSRGGTFLAFNLADVFALAGAVLLLIAAA